MSEVAAWIHWCGSATVGDPRKGYAVCSGCRYEVDWEAARMSEIQLLVLVVETTI